MPKGEINMKKIVKKIYYNIVNAGTKPEDREEIIYRKRSINRLCLLCILISSPYLFIFYYIHLMEAFFLILVAHFFFSMVIYLNYKNRNTAGNFLLLSTTALSVLIISIMLGFESGFHLYLYTAPLFVFWLFDTNDTRNILLAFFIYLTVYGMIFFFKYNYTPLYNLDLHLTGLNLYSLNMILNLILLFMLFYNYSTYYRILAKTLLLKQENLEQEIKKRNQSEDDIKKLFTELSHSYTNLEQFNFVVSHNLKSPLSNIKGFLGLYDKNGKDSESNKKIIDYIEIATNNLTNILDDLNYILKSRKQLLNRKIPVRLFDVIENIKLSLVTEIENSKAVIVQKYDPAITINTIETILHSILFNLIQNALKFRQENIDSEIIIQATKTDHETTLIISDNGVGMDLEKYHCRIFNLYQRFHPTIEGKGIGLYLVKNQIELMGGSIQVESRLNEGTSFILKIIS